MLMRFGSFGQSNDPTHPNQTLTPHPRSLSWSLIASKIRYLSRENFTPWGLDLSTARATANERHILLTSSVSAPHAVQCSLAAASARHLQLHQFTPQNHGSELLLCPSGRAVALRACDQAHYSESRIVRP